MKRMSKQKMVDHIFYRWAFRLERVWEMKWEKSIVR